MWRSVVAGFHPQNPMDQLPSILQGIELLREGDEEAVRMILSGAHALDIKELWERRGEWQGAFEGVEQLIRRSAADPARADPHLVGYLISTLQMIGYASGSYLRTDQMACLTVPLAWSVSTGGAPGRDLVRACLREAPPRLEDCFEFNLVSTMSAWLSHADSDVRACLLLAGLGCVERTFPYPYAVSFIEAMVPADYPEIAAEIQLSAGRMRAELM